MAKFARGIGSRGKLVQHGIKKVLPGRELLEEAYRRAWTREFVRQANHRAREQAREGASEIDVPDAIRTQLAAALKKRPGLPWDLARSPGFVKNSVSRSPTQQGERRPELWRARPVPPDLQRQVEAAFKEGPGLPWDVALARIVKNEVAREGDSAR